jgi:hypothetical protein
MNYNSHVFTTWTDSIYWLKRGKFTSQTKLFVGIIGLICAPFVIPWLLPNYATMFAFSACVVIMAYLLVSRYFAERIRRSFGKAEVCEFRHVATPFTSMFETLGAQQVRPADIVHLTVETGRFSNLFAYLNADGKILMELRKENPDASIHIYGLNDLSKDHAHLKGELSTLGAPQIKFHDTPKLSLAHRNVVRVKDGRIYLWFEEHHEIENGHHYFPLGAFLFKIDDDTATRVEHEVAKGIPFRPEPGAG